MRRGGEGPLPSLLPPGLWISQEAQTLQQHRVWGWGSWGRTCGASPLPGAGRASPEGPGPAGSAGFGV